MLNSQLVDVGDTTIEVFDDQESGPVVCTTHPIFGWTAASTDVRAETGDGCRLVLVNFRGQGGSSPARELSASELGGYLDYCSELLSVISKLAALQVQHFHDAVTLAAVNEIETLTTGLSSKIWQKITLLGRTTPPLRPEPR